MKAAENLTVTVNGDVIVLFEAIDEVTDMGLTDDFYSKVINNKVEKGGVGDVAENAGCVASWDVAVICKVFDKFNVCESSGLGKTIHTGTDFGKDSIVFDEG